MSALMPYYRKQVLIAVGIGAVYGMLVGQWSSGLVVAAWSVGFAIWAPRSGRFVVDPSRGADALVQDERSKAIGARAAEIALGVFLGGCGVLWFGLRARGVDSIPTDALAFLMVFAMGALIATDGYLRSR